MNAIYKLDLGAINEMQASTASETLAKSGRAHSIDIVIRRDGKETRYEADWLKHLRLLCLDGCGDQANGPVANAICKRP